MKLTPDEQLRWQSLCQMHPCEELLQSLIRPQDFSPKIGCFVNHLKNLYYNTLESCLAYAQSDPKNRSLVINISKNP